jgi:HEAT repeat protein
MSDRTKGGQSKMEAASKVVRELIRDYPEGRRLGLVVYGHDRSRECQAVDVVRPLSVLDGPGRQQLIQYVADLKPAGHTPIARALEAAAGEMASAKGLSRVVLITDGMESCHGNPVQAAADLVAKTKSTVDVIGFALKPEESQAIDQIARAGRGKFYDAQTAEKLRKDLRFVAQVAPQVEPKAPVDDGKISPAVQALIEQLSDEEANVRHAAAESLGKMGARAKGAVPALMQRLADDLWGSRNNPVNLDNSSGNTSKDSALRALQQLDSGKVEAALVGATKSKNAKTRAWASAQLAPSDTENKSKRPAIAVAEPPANGDVPPAVKALIDQLSDEEANVRHAAAESLGKLGSRAKPAAPALMQRLADDLWGSKANPVNLDNSSGNTSKDAALKALKQIAPDKVEPALIEAMRAKNSKTKAWAAAQLGKQ